MGGTLIELAATPVPNGLSNRLRPGYSAPMTASQTRLVAILTGIAVAAALRLVPHPPNFTPIGAMALFSGAYLGRKGLMLALAAPLGALLLSDLALGFYEGMWIQYVAVALVAVLGWAALSKSKGALRVGLSAVAGSLIFFLISNLGVWWLSGFYSHDAAGLAACFTAAIPFYQNSLAGDLFFAALLFGGFALLEKAVPRVSAQVA